jgi:hypothetical protein
MKTFLRALFIATSSFLTLSSRATTLYVDLNNPTPTPPYETWSTAATNIQVAIDAAGPGDLVLVTNGVYAVGGKVMFGDLTNRIALDKAITLQSVNGPWFTTIFGNGATNGTAAVRCAWLTNGAELNGFTLTAGATRTSGDQTNLLNGGGALCLSNAVLRNCLVISNAAQAVGGGVFQGSLGNSALIGNRAGSGSAAGYATLLNCTVVSNWQSAATFQSRHTNTIAYHNFQNFSGGIFAFSCTTPAPGGIGNITTAPQLYSDSVHLLETSPCRNVGTNLTVGTDIDGQAWNNPPSIGCDEWRGEPVIVFQPRIQQTIDPIGFNIAITPAGATPFTCFWTRNGTLLANDGHFSQANSTNLVATGITSLDTGFYQVVVSNIFGAVTSAVAPLTIRYADVASTSPLPPFTSWAGAAANIQDAIDVAADGDLILVTNGVYAAGGRVMAGDLTNRIAITKAVAVRSVNGPWATTIRGGGATNGTVAVRCAWLTNGAILQGFTLTAGATRTVGDASTLRSGGGVWCASTNAIVAHCVIRSNTGTGNGVGFFQGTLRSSYVVGNQGSPITGGAVANAEVVNCTVISNLAFGVVQTAANLLRVTNSIVYYNLQDYSGGTLAYTCANPLASGSGNISNAPQLQADGIHLSATSPCRNAGTNIANGTDLFGQAWEVPPSMGCAEWVSTPAFEMQPALTLTNNPGGFTVRFKPSGQEPFAYYWYHDGTLLSDDGHFAGATSTNLTVRKIQDLDAGLYWVVVSNSFGVATSQIAPLVIHFVNASGSNPQAPYTNWNSAAVQIQDAIDAAQSGEVVMVTNGIYNTGGKIMVGDLLNRVAIDKPITVTSVNGYRVSFIEGAWDPVSTNGNAAVRGVWMTNGATLRGFTVRNGATRTIGSTAGGGIAGTSTNATVVNCLLTNNSAYFLGGGAYSATLKNCVLTDNSAISTSGGGGGAANSSLYNCTVVNNLCFGFGTPFFRGAGTRDSFIRNSIVGNNLRRDFTTFYVPDDHFESSSSLGGIWYSCCPSSITLGQGNILTNLIFLDAAYHIPVVSPCRGTGSLLYSSGEDMDGEPWANPPSMGADEVIDANLVGPISLTLNVTPSTNALANPPLHPLFFTDSITGRVSRIDWDFGDGVILTNAGYSISHSWTTPGSYSVTSTVYNNDYPAGVAASVMIQVHPLLAPTLQLEGLDASGFKFSFDVQEYGYYRVQYATNLAPPITWHSLQLLYPNFTGPTQITDPAWTNAARFYRVLAQ